MWVTCRKITVFAWRTGLSNTTLKAGKLPLSKDSPAYMLQANAPAVSVKRSALMANLILSPAFRLTGVERAYNAAATILQQHPDLIGFYANNDGMALGVVEAVRAANKSGQVAVFGTDGISDAYASIKRGELTGTVDSFPILTGEVAMEVMLRLIDGQKISRVVSTPQALITKENADAFSTKDNDKLRELLKQQ
jgi:hypothetical protein